MRFNGSLAWPDGSYQTASSLSFSSDLARGVRANASVERRRHEKRGQSFSFLARFVRRTKEKRETSRSESMTCTAKWDIFSSSAGCNLPPCLVPPEAGGFVR